MRPPRLMLLMMVLTVLLSGCRVYEAETPEVSPELYAEANKNATHKELDSLTLAPRLGGQRLASLCLDAEGNILVCDAQGGQIQVMSPEGKHLATWQPGLTPLAIAADADGTVFVASGDKLAKLDKSGEVLKTVGTGGAQFVSGMAVTKTDVFLAAWAETGFSVHRFDHNLENPKEIASRLRGCCGTLDIAAHDGVLYVAENARHRVVKFDREGKSLGSWGEHSRTDPAGFSSCCNPMNLCIDATGKVYTAESDRNDRIKSYTGDGKYLALAGSFLGGKSCRCVDIAVSKDGSRLYVADTRNNTVRVLGLKGTASETAATNPPPAPADAPTTGGGD